MAAAALVYLVLAGSSGGPLDPIVLGGLAVVLILAKAVGDLFVRVGQPAVLGELVAGVLIGNIDLAVGWAGLEMVIAHPAFGSLAELGVILLLFQVGLESDLHEMARVGATALGVAVIGVIVPILLGFGVHMWMAPEATWHVHLFIGAVLAATSVGITARVLRDLGKIDSSTSRVILGAAVIDDVLGLVILAVVAGIVSGVDSGKTVDALEIARISGLALGFLVGAIALGRPASRLLLHAVGYLQLRGVLLAASLAFCFAMAFGAAEVGLHPIVGAFAAGLVLDRVSYKSLESKENHGLEVQLHPIADFLMPIFFVATGAAVDLGNVSGDMLLLAGALTVVAIIGKQACSLVAFGAGINRLAVGIGMVPRGEVGLIFANVGASLTMGGEPVISPPTFAAVVVMVMVTTLITPPLLSWALGRGE